MKIGKYNIEKEDDYQYGWIYILPSIEVQHKYWYLWRVSFSWLKWSALFNIVREDWNKYNNNIK